MGAADAAGATFEGTPIEGWHRMSFLLVPLYIFLCRIVRVSQNFQIK